MHLLRAVLVNASWALGVANADATPVALDAVEVTVRASGSLNGVAGFGSVDRLLVLPTGSSLEFFTIELTDFSVTSWEPSGNSSPPFFYELRFQFLNPFSAASLQWGTPTVGDAFTVSGAHNSGVWEKALGLVTDSGVLAPQLYSTQGWNFGGVEASTVTTFSITAFGEAPSTVPETTSTGVLMLTGLSAVVLCGIRFGRATQSSTSR